MKLSTKHPPSSPSNSLPAKHRLVPLLALAILLTNCSPQQVPDVPSADSDAPTTASDATNPSDGLSTLDVMNAMDVPDPGIDSTVVRPDAQTTDDLGLSVDVLLPEDVPGDGQADGFSPTCAAMGGACVVGTADIVTGPIYGSRCPAGTVAYNSGNEGMGTALERFENRYGAGCGIAPRGSRPNLLFDTPIVCCVPVVDAR